MLALKNMSDKWYHNNSNGTMKYHKANEILIGRTNREDAL